MRKTISLKHVTLIVLQCLVSAALPAQPPNHCDYRFGGTQVDQLNSLQQTADGGYILGGWSYSPIGGDKTEASWGYNDYWVVKIDASGVKQWDKRFGGTSGERLNSLQQTADGGYILGGGSSSGIDGDKSEDSRGFGDYWVVKIDANGVKQWDRRFGGASVEDLNSLQQTADGGYILGGVSRSGIDGDKTEESRGADDYWVVKIDASGVKQWDKRFGGTDYDYLHSLQQTADGGYILGGESHSGIGGDKTEASRGYTDYWVVKIDANGAKQWDKSFGGTDYDELISLKQTADGGYILGGGSNSGIGGDKTEESRGSEDYWVVKLDANGVKQWDKSFGGTDYEYLLTLQQTSDGGYILGGYSSSGIGGDKTEESRGNADYWVVKIDASGAKQWDKRFGGTSGDVLRSLQQTADGDYILGGQSSSGIGGDKTQDTRGSSDYWIVKMGCSPNTTTCNDVYETNNTSKQAKAISLGAVISAGISSTTDVDWFKVTVPNANNTLRVTLSNLPADYDLYVYKKNLALVGSSANMGTSNELVSFSSDVRNTTYYIKVIGKNGAYDESECYNLLAQISSSAQPVTNVSNLIDEITEESAKQLLYPIPAADFVHLRFNSNVAGPSTVQILNTVGQLVKQYPVSIAKGINELQIPLHDVKPGMYILKVNKDGLSIIRKFAIAK